FSEHEPLLASDDTWRRSPQRNYSPGYEAVGRDAPMKSSKTDQDDTRLPWPLGYSELNKGVGRGAGKK
ncbi:unnamed protein product, partial [Toxocara canis]|uniref:PRC-barrel domain containing protein n=1 Tax=Toxocara canis TaxID=6265 RepID=A0A183U855_TOXCA